MYRYGCNTLLAKESEGKSFNAIFLYPCITENISLCSTILVHLQPVNRSTVLICTESLLSRLLSSSIKVALYDSLPVRGCVMVVGFLQQLAQVFFR